MLVAERNLQMEDGLAVALKPEVAGLDDASVNGSDRDFMDLFARDCEERRDRRNYRLASVPTPGIAPGPPRLVIPERLPPGVSVRAHGPLLRDLALEVGDLRARLRHRRECIVRARRQHDKLPSGPRQD